MAKSTQERVIKRYFDKTDAAQERKYYSKLAEANAAGLVAVPGEFIGEFYVASRELMQACGGDRGAAESYIEAMIAAGAYKAEVQQEEKEVYRVFFETREDKLHFHCDCLGHQTGWLCIHVPFAGQAYKLQVLRVKELKAKKQMRNRAA